MPDSAADTLFIDWNHIGRKYTVPRVSRNMKMPDHLLSLPYTYCDAPMQRVAQEPAMMLRCLKNRGGIVAVLGSNIWIATKAMSNAAIRVNNAMMRPSFH